MTRLRRCLLCALLAAAGCADGPPDGSLRRLATPAAPYASGVTVLAEQVAVLQLPAPPRHLVLSDAALYVFLNRHGLATLDLSDPARPRLAHWLQGAMANDDQRGHHFLNGILEPERARLVVADRSQGITFIDVSQPLAPRVERTIEFPGDLPTAILPDGNGYYVAGGGRGLFHLAEGWSEGGPIKPVLTDFDHVKDLRWLAPNLLVFSDHVQNGLQVLDVSRRDAPRALAVFSLRQYCDSLQVIGQMVALQVRELGVVLVNLEKPERPWIQSVLPTGGISSLTCMARWGEHRLLVGDTAGTIQILDLEDQARPCWVGRILARSSIACLETRGDLLYVGLNHEPAAEAIRPGHQFAVYRLTARRVSDPEG